MVPGSRRRKRNASRLFESTKELEILDELFNSAAGGSTLYIGSQATAGRDIRNVVNEPGVTKAFLYVGLKAHAGRDIKNTVNYTGSLK